MKNHNNFIKILLKIPVPWVYILTYLIGVLLQLLIPVRISPEGSINLIKIAGAVLLLAGIIIAGWSLIIFNKAHTTTTPGESSKKLIIQGPYKITRNPMYVSLILAYIGEAGLLIQIWPVVVLPLVLLYVNRVVIPLEEDVLKHDFGDEYIEYCSKVRRWL
jgi:protein-S-isoprenylcysteine O-methyltransferase Ste14